MLRIHFDRKLLSAGEPCVEVEPVNNGRGSINHLSGVWNGFTFTRGVLFVKAEGGHAWMEFHGEDEWLTEGGRLLTPTRDVESRFLNLFPDGELSRLADDSALKYVAVNRGRVLAGNSACVTVYTGEGSMLVPEARLEGYVRSCIVVPPILGSREPLNVWLETTWKVDF